MCGIAGIYAYGRAAVPVEADELVIIRDAMKARGPDGAGLWLREDRRIGLAHRRLSIIDLSDDAAQPMTDGKGLHVSYNGEIYNYRELRRDLEQGGAIFRTGSDTEVLLHLYRRDGMDMVRYLRGMYAFALWDDEKRELILGRDPFGVKPLYYADDGATIRVASQVKALLAGGHIATEPDAAGHAGFFLWGYIPEPYSLYRAIRALPAGHVMRITAEGARAPVAFFDLAEECRRAEQVRHEADMAGRTGLLGEALAASVSRHLIADVPVGLFLSAGIDSGVLASLTSATAAQPVRSITLAFDEFTGTAIDEAPLAEYTARHFATKHKTVRVHGTDFRADYHALLQAMDQPTIDGTNTYFVSKAAAGSGLKVALSGIGGDEIFGGYPSFRQVPALASLLRPFARLQSCGKVARWLAAPITGRLTSPKYAGLLEYGSSFGGAYLLRRALYMPWEIDALLPPEMAAAGLAELDTVAKLDGLVRDIRSTRLRMSMLEMSCYMRNCLLRDADWAGMAHSLEIRVPFVDVDLFRSLAPLLASDLPPTKTEMARAVARPLPDAIVHRPKSGFVTPVRDWLARDDTPTATARGDRPWARRVYDSQNAPP